MGTHRDPSTVDFSTYAAWFDDALAAAAPKEKRPLQAFTVAGMSVTSGEGTFSLEKLSGADVKLGPPVMKPSE